MRFGSINLRWQAWLAAILGFCVSAEAYAAFNGFIPLAHSGQVAYRYGYVENAGSQSEATSFLIGWNASGYVWRPWFATTSMALNVGLSKTETTTNTTEGTTGTGNLSLGVFPRSRFPFSVRYSVTDSRTQQFQDISQVSGGTSYRVTRMSLRQSYRPRAYNQLYGAWYNSTKFEGGSFNSDSESYGMDYRLRVSRQTLTLGGTHSGSRTQSSTNKPTTDTVSLSHVYTPSPDLGVSSLVSYVEVNPGGSLGVSLDTQAFSSFFWQPEHRPVNVTGAVRLSESRSEGATNAVSRSLNTSLGMGYRITRLLSMNAAVSVGTSDSQSVQTLSTTQTLSLSYTGGHQQWEGYAYSWSWSGSAANSTVRTEVGAQTTSTDRQNVSTGISHGLAKSWSLARSSSLSASFSQSVSGSKSSDVDVTRSTLSHSASLGMNSRNGRGSSYLSVRLSDSRSFGETDSVFNSYGVNYNADLVFNRLSSISGNLSFTASQNESEDELGATETEGTKNLLGGMTYIHNRPFGVYSLRFTTNLQGRKQIDSPEPTTTLRSESIFRYSLGRLATSLSLRLSESAGGVLSKSMNFQATRSF